MTNINNESWSFIIIRNQLESQLPLASHEMLCQWFQHHNYIPTAKLLYCCLTSKYCHSGTPYMAHKSCQLIIMRLTLPTIKCHVPHVASFVSGDLEVSFMKGFWLRLCFMVAQSHIGYSWQIQCTYCPDRAHVLFGATRFVSVVPHYL